MDFSYLSAQTLGDAALQRELLELFLAQARAVLPELAGMGLREGNDTAHRLRGSCHGIGARAAAAAAQDFEDATGPQRAAALERFLAAMGETQRAILDRLAAA